MFDQALLLLKRLATAKRHSGAGENTSAWRFIRQGIPYYLNRRGYARLPLTIFFTINSRCNLHCRMCDIGQQKEESMFYRNLKGNANKDFPFDRFKGLIDEVKDFKPYIGITTTEPLLYPHIFDAVEYAASRGLKTNISTNGLLLDRFADEILDSGLHKLSLSLDGPPAVHDGMRGLPGTYARVVNGLKLLKEKKRSRGMTLPHIYITTFIADANYGSLVEFMEGLPLEGIERVNIKLMVFFTKDMAEAHNNIFKDTYPATVSCVPNDFSPENLDIDVLYKQAKEIEERFGSVCALHFEPDKKKLEKYFYRPSEFMDSTRCVLPWFIAQISAQGDLLPLTRCYDISLGNVMDKPFLDVWNGPDARKFRMDLQKQGRFPACARCDGVLYR